MTIVQEQEIIERAKTGDELALRRLIDEYAPVVYKFSYHVCRNKDKAENTTQDTFLSVLKNLRQFDNRAKFSTWLYSIVTNNCLMQARSAKPERFVSLDDEDSMVSDDTLVHSGASPLDHAERSDIKQLLDKAIELLQPEYRIVFVLRDLEGLSTEEVAQVTNISVPAVKSRLHRARKFLRDYLTPYLMEKSNVSK